jgi:ADP-heptose:LPS heptosyltransferase
VPVSSKPKKEKIERNFVMQESISPSETRERALSRSRFGAQIALIKVGALGDVVRTTTLVPALKRRYPDMSLTWITGRDAFPLISGNPNVARTVLFDDPSDASWRQIAYEWIICLDDEDALCALASELNGARRSGGYRVGSGCGYTDDLAPWFGMGLLRPASQGGLERANELKRKNKSTYGEIIYRCLGFSETVVRPFIAVPDSERRGAREWLERRGLERPLIGLNTGAGARWRFKSWGEEQTAELARLIVDQLHAAVVILGGPSERERNERIVALARRQRVYASPNDLNLLAFAALIERCNVLISSDSLGLHLATAMRRHIVAFFGPTSAAEIDLYGLGEKIITPLGCSNCYLRDCDVRPNCMDSIPVSLMFAATSRQLASQQ